MKSFDVYNSKTILLIGSGRMATHLLHWNSILSSPNKILTWNRSEDPKILKQFLIESNLVWLAISDSAITPFFERHLKDYSGSVVHFSGALNDPRMKCAHPLMTFPTELLDNSVYNDIFFALTEALSLAEVLPGFTNSSFQLSEKEKPLYHALCVVAGNFPQLLWNEVDQKRSDLKIPDAAFNIYLQQSLNNFLKLKAKALTGPLIRGDLLTIQKNTDALVNTKLKSIYTAFVKEFSI